MQPTSRMEEAVAGSDKAGIQPAIHAIGDRATAEILDIFARAGGDDARNRRFRIEHAQHVRPEDFARFA
ncbi:MAG: amidohydrolase, partial [Acidobacteria bacterium]